MSFHNDLAALVESISLDHLSDEASIALQNTVTDTIGCAFGASREEFALPVVRAAQDSFGTGPCTVVGRPEKLSPAGAAMVNGTLAHGWDHDDVHMPSIAHLSAVVIPAALAAAEFFRSDGRTFLEAVVAGDEVGGRIGWAVCAPELGGSAIRDRNFFPTAILGTLASAAAVAKAAGLDRAATAEAIAIACSYASGLASVSRGDNSTKRSQAGWAAQAGVCAALMAARGFTGPDSVLETRQGFFEAFAGGKFDAEQLSRPSGSNWICQEMSFKWYPLEYMIHPLVELADSARDAVRPMLDRITRIEASVPSRFATLFEPKAKKVSPADRFQALISAPYCIARSLLKNDDGHLLLRDFRDRYVENEQTRKLADRIEFVACPEMDAAFPHHVSGALRFLDGSHVVWQGKVDDVYGSPQRPLSTDHLRLKFADNCKRFPEGTDMEIFSVIQDIENQPDSEWIGALAR